MRDAVKVLADCPAEQATLGACLIDPERLMEIIDIVDEASFCKNGHQYIYRALLNLFEADEPIEYTTIGPAIAALTNIDNIGFGKLRGMEYVMSLQTAPGIYAYSIKHYATIVADMAHRRELVLGCQRAVKGALDLGAPLAHTIETGAQTLLNISSNGHGDIRPMGADFDKYAHHLVELMDDPNKRSPGIRTGYTDIDTQTSGLERGKLWIVAGRPGMGKTAWLIGLTWNLSVERDRHVAVFSLEMSREELYKRLIAYKARVNLQDMSKGLLDDEDNQRVNHAIALLGPAKERIWIDDTGDLTPVQIRARATKASIRMGLDYLWLDYLQLVNVPGATGESQNYIQATVAAREMKNLAKHLDIPVIAASQLSRRVEFQEHKRPDLSHLRDSGAIEEAADLVGLLFRPGYYPELLKKDSSLDPTLAEFIIAKHRDGPSGVAYLRWLAECAGYKNAYRGEP